MRQRGPRRAGNGAPGSFALRGLRSSADFIAGIKKVPIWRDRSGHSRWELFICSTPDGACVLTVMITMDLTSH